MSDETGPVEDAFFISAAGLGTTADRTRNVRIDDPKIWDHELATYFENDGLFQNLLTRKVQDALRGGFHVKVGDDTSPERAQAINNEIKEWCETSSIELVWCQHFAQNNTFGGAALLEATERDQTITRNPTAIYPETRFLTLAPAEISGEGENTTDPLLPNYGRPARWRIGTRQIDTSWMRITTTRGLYGTHYGPMSSARTHMWTGPSRARLFLEEIKRWGMSLQAATSALQTLSQLVLASDTFGLTMTGGAGPAPTSGQAAANANMFWGRISDIASRRSSMQPIGINTKDRLEVLNSTVSGIPEVLDRLMIAICAAADGIPAILAFGVSPSGFGTGESELKIWHGKVEDFRRLELTPVMRWTLERKFGPQVRDWQICFPPLDIPTAAELAELRLKQSQVDTAYVSAQILAPEEVAMSRFGGGEYSTETHLDLELRAARQLDEQTETESDENKSEGDDVEPPERDE